MSFALLANVYAEKKPSLMLAIKANDLEKAKSAIEAGADVNEGEGSGTMIYWAVFYTNCDMIKLLVEKGAKIDGTTPMFGLTALNFAVDGAKEPSEIAEANKKTNERVLKNFTEEKAREKGWWANTDPSKYSTLGEKTKLLLELGANPNLLQGNGTVKEWTPFLTAVDKGKMELVKIMLESKKVDTEFRFHQWSEGVVSFVNYVEAGKYVKADRNDVKYWASLPRFDTPLLYAIDKDNLELVKLLVENGASLYNGKKVQETEKGTTYWKYLSPLDFAIRKGNADIISYLKSKDAVMYQE